MDAKVIVSGAILVGLLLFAASDTKPQRPKQQRPQCWTDQDGKRWCQPVYQSQAELARSDRYYAGEARPAVDLPYELRKKNWGGGSCVHATTITLLRWLADGSGDTALIELTESWPYSGGEYSSRHKSRIEAANLRFVMTVDGDEELLRWSIATRRGCGIAYRGHCVTLAGYDAATGEALILDNNRTSVYKRQPWPELVDDWQRGGGWAFAFVYDPPAPIPTARLAVLNTAVRP